MVTTNAPDRIHNWQHTMLSIARHYGGCTYNGVEYVIAHDEEGQPLVRRDVKFPKKTKRAQKRGEDNTSPMQPHSYGLL